MTRALIVGLQYERLELIQAVINASSPLLFHYWLVALALKRLLAHLFHLDIHAHLESI